ncbi:MAG: hypothetical protein ACI8ZM_001487 [Crocinitomix sp.]|jgi:hypothetical protein
MKRLFIFLLIVSCGPQVDDFERVNFDSTNGPERLEIYAFYPLGDKYFDKNDSLKLEEWMTNKTDLLCGLGCDSELCEGRNVFEHKGGGPNGAEWNAESDLYFAIFHSGVDAYQLFLNDSLSAFEVIQKPIVDWIRIPSETWMRILRPLENEDLPFLYDKAEIESEKSELSLRLAPLKTGEVIKFTLKSDSLERVNYFHVAYGE